MKESDSGPEMPGLFQAVIEGLGDIAVYRRYAFLGALRQDTLVAKQQRVLESGPIHKKLLPGIRNIQARVERKIGKRQYDSRGHWDESLEDMWVSTLCRILIGVRRYGHGGAILISDTSNGLRPKYVLRYPRLAESLFSAGTLLVQNCSFSDAIYDKYLASDEAEHIPVDLYLDESVSKVDLDETQDETTGCIRFIASLSRVDGLIWMNHDLSLQGFGVEITTTEEPKGVFRALNSGGTRSREVDMNHYGTRHRSMIRHCAANPDSIGFVISQDGDVRAITNVGGKIVLWEDVHLQFSS